MAELLIPLIAFGGLYLTTRKEQEGFQQSRSKELPNTNIPDRNYPPDEPSVSTDLEQTSRLSTINKYDQQSAYTDKYFTNPPVPVSNGSSFQSITGQRVSADYFQHNNMVPYFGAKNRSVIKESNTNESILDTYSGSGTQFIKKSEQSPLFSPGEHLQYAHGAPNQNDFFQSRVNPSLRMANVKPFQEQQVGPGLGLGYTNEGSGGYNSGMAMREAWMPKSVDQLRTNNNQRASGVGLFGHEGPANSSIKTLGSIGDVEKNRVERTFDMGPERYFTTTGVEKAPPLHAIPMDRYVKRPETSASYAGIAGAHNSEMYNRNGEFMESKHMDLGPVPLGGARQASCPTVSDFEMQAQRAYPNNRSSNSSETYFGAFSGAIGAVIAPLLDELRPSRKENVLGTLRPYENAHTKVSSSYLFNPNDRPATTIRETTEINKFTSGVNRNQNGGAYNTTPHQSIHNQRETTTDVFYAGNASAGDRTKSIRPYDAEYRQRNNETKSSTIQGHMVPGNMNLMNADIQMRNRNGEISNTRPLTRTNAPQQFHSAETIGAMQNKQTTYSNLQMDRNTPDILDAFRQNPYTHSLTNIA